MIPKTALRPVVAAALFAALALVATACGEKSEKESGSGPEAFDLALDFTPNADHVGIYQTQAAGFFEDAGLDVNLRVPSDPSAPIKQVAGGQVDLAISYEPEVLLAREQGLDVVAVGALVQKPLTSLISLPKAKIDDPEDLDGKTVGTAGIPYQTKYLEAILRRAGVDSDAVKQVDLGLNLQAPLLAGKVDATLGGFKNVEGVELQERKKDPRVVPVDELGIPTYDELVLVASEDRLADDPEPVRLFIAALGRGTAQAEKDPARGTQALLDAEKGLDPKLTEAQVKATLPVLEPEGDVTYGFLNTREWEEFAGFMVDEGLLEERPQIADVLTNRLLPGEKIEGK